MNKFYFFPQEKHSWCSNKHFTELDLNMAGLTLSSPFERFLEFNFKDKCRMWVESGKPFRSPHSRQQVTRSHIPIPQKGPTGPKKGIKARFWGNSNKNVMYTYCDCHPPVILERTHSKKASSIEIFVRPNGQRSCYENKPVRIAIGERGKEDECGEVEVGGCVSPHPRQHGRWFD